MLDYSGHFNLKSTPANEPIPGRSDMIPNLAGGFAFKISSWKQFDRFLILGSEGGSYYANEKALTKDNAENVIACIIEDGEEAVRRIVSVSQTGRAPKNDQAIFALALVCTFGNQDAKNDAYRAINSVCRIGTHIFQFCQNIQSMRGWSRGLRTGVASFYHTMSADELAYQLVKYRQRNGWTHRDVLRLSHPPTNPDLNSLYRYAVKKPVDVSHSLISAFESLQNTTDVKTACRLIEDYKLPREAVPTELLNSKDIWNSLLKDMPLTALIRNLGKMTAVGLLQTNFDESVKHILFQLANMEALKKARIHPLSVLTALKIYIQGHGDKGKLVWNPVGLVGKALHDCFYLSFGTVKPTHKNWLLGLDVSSSMDGARISGSPLSAREATAAMAMLLVRTEPNYETMAFANDFIPLPLSAHDSLDAVIKKMQAIPFGHTNCSMPMLYAADKKMPIDIFAIYTDNETNCGKIHPIQALNKYRRESGRLDAKLIVVGMCANNVSISDPTDGNSLDVVGFDTATPEIMNMFASGQI